MPASTSPFFGINYGWAYGESGWNSGMDENLQVMSFLDKGAVNDVVSSLPSTPANGYSVINTTDKLLYTYIGTWKIISPQEGMRLYVINLGQDYQYLGGVWTQQATNKSLQTSVESLQTFNTNLTSASNNQGASLIPRNAQVVATIADFRQVVKTTASKYVLLTGYYAAGDTGRSRLYYLDTSDTTSTDNGGTVIVVSDGGRWKMADKSDLSFKDFGCKVDGTTDDTVFAQNAINASVGRELKVNTGTMIVSSLQGLTNSVIMGDSRQNCVIKRKNSDTGINPTLYFVGKSRFRLENFSVDGNKTSQTLTGYNIALTGGCFDFLVKGVGSYACKDGNGITVQDTTDKINLTKSSIEDCYVVNNDGVGINITSAWFFQVESNTCSNNKLDGISVVNFSNPPPTSPTEQFYKLIGNTCGYNGGSGLGVSGYIDSYNGNLQVTGTNRPTTYGAIISDNTLINNTKYGLVFQSRNTSITNNVINNNGDSTLNGGALLNMTDSIFANNNVESNYFYGVDAGGALNCIFTTNTITSNGTNSGAGSLGLNVGAGQGLVIDSNIFKGNGDSVNGGTNINIRGFDGGTDPVFNTLTRRIFIKNNYIHLLNTLTYGISASDAPIQLVVKNNEVFAGDINRAYSLRCQNILRSGNLHWPTAAGDYSVAAGNPVVIPDAVEKVTISGTGDITNILTDGGNYYLGKISAVSVLTGGSYTPDSLINLTFSGGGATTQAQGRGIVNNSGSIAAVEITNLGSGYTSAPTVTPASGTATFAATVGLNNMENNEIQVFLSSTAVLVSGTGNLRLSGGNFTGNAQKMITLYGRGGFWYEKSRS